MANSIPDLLLIWKLRLINSTDVKLQVFYRIACIFMLNFSPNTSFFIILIPALFYSIEDTFYMNLHYWKCKKDFIKKEDSH